VLKDKRSFRDKVAPGALSRDKIGNYYGSFLTEETLQDPDMHVH